MRTNQPRFSIFGWFYEPCDSEDADGKPNVDGDTAGLKKKRKKKSKRKANAEGSSVCQKAVPSNMEMSAQSSQSTADQCGKKRKPTEADRKEKKKQVVRKE